jgi:predicted transcriptional regulator
MTCAEADVLDTFAEYLMPPEQMLCLANSDVPAVKQALERLVGRGWLTVQKFKGSYALTVDGFKAMQHRRSARSLQHRN